MRCWLGPTQSATRLSRVARFDRYIPTFFYCFGIYKQQFVWWSPSLFNKAKELRWQQNISPVGSVYSIFIFCGMQIQTWKGSKLLAILWLLLISLLCFLPGSALPKANWLDDISFDKWVHFGLFTVLLFLWRFEFPSAKNYDLLIVLIAALYGFGIEVIQHYFIPNRSFDLYDILADVTGAIAGVGLWVRIYKKNRPL